MSKEVLMKLLKHSYSQYFSLKIKLSKAVWALSNFERKQ